MKILSFGSLNYDYTYEVEHFLAPKETLAAKSMQRGFGGKGANQSIAFARAGLSIYHAGRVGADGQPFVDYLKQNGIHTDYLIKDDAAATGHAIIEVCRGENCILIYGGANQEITTEQIDHTLKAFSPGDWLVLQNEISNLPYLMQAAQKKGLSIFFNAAPYDVGILTYPMELVDVLCVNEVEACALAGTETFEADAVLTLLHEKYPQTRLLLTAGSAGSYYLDAERDLNQLQGDLLMLQEDELLKRMRADTCMFNQAKKCGHCFSCIGLIEKKTPAELDAFETAKLLDYKLYQLNLDEFARKVNQNYKKNGGQDEILYSMNRDVERMLKVTTEIHNPAQNLTRPVAKMGKGMRSIYMLSLLETYTGTESRIPSILMIEDPEIFLHPKLQKVSGEILYRLSRKNQVIFSTHSPNLLANFNSRQIVLDGEGYSKMCEKTDVSAILEDLGYTASDLMNVNFVFIVEGKQDKSRLPLLIRKYYSETYDESGKLSRIAIITTNSCTNIKTYANLKYMNQIYLRDQFLMIRDGDGKDRMELGRQLCRYYEQRNLEDVDTLPKVRPENVLILKYYSFENYFFNPKVMTELGVVESEETFYETLFEKWKEYLHRLSSGKHLTEVLGFEMQSISDIKAHMEEIKIYLRGHNLYDIFYGRYKDQEEELLKRYIDLAPREDFSDILDAIDHFIYFESRKRERDTK